MVGDARDAKALKGVDHLHGPRTERARGLENRLAAEKGRDGSKHAHGETRFSAVDPALFAIPGMDSLGADERLDATPGDDCAHAGRYGEGGKAVVAQGGMPYPRRADCQEGSCGRARTVMLFEGGAATVPLTAEGLINLIPYPLCDLARPSPDRVDKQVRGACVGGHASPQGGSGQPLQGQADGEGASCLSRLCGRAPS